MITEETFTGSLVRLVGALTKQTKAGAIDWLKTDVPDTFVYVGRTASVHLSPSGIRIRENETTRLVWEMPIGQFSMAPQAEAEESVKELLELVRRRVLQPVSVIDDMIADISSHA